MTTAQRRKPTAVFTAAVIALGAAACSSSSGAGTGGGPLSYDRVRSTALDLFKNRSTACPFGLDFTKAAADAGIGGAVAPAVTDGRSVKGNAGDGVPAQPWPSGATHPPTMTEMPATPPSAQITCSYTVGPSTVDVELLAVPKTDYGVSMMLPAIQRAGLLSVDQLSRFAGDRPAVGQTRLTPGQGTAAVSRVALRGEGDLVLLLSQNTAGADPDPALAGEPLRKAAETLAGQLH
ncbi:hypothetical protein [Kitasatospora sp. SUK 42]|uniref:hypothetical protein n=1 Tax=Kitasatospora sp. SUK 42 TaxID=1588882 RepID=UPI0018C9B850|nr:hypothetical protein [Kitasatospora sp. SUK 42]MBV2152892.1 hypothetical protein [Kitasatospora sp. SUK 42]